MPKIRNFSRRCKSSRNIIVNSFFAACGLDFPVVVSSGGGPDLVCGPSGGMANPQEISSSATAGQCQDGEPRGVVTQGIPGGFSEQHCWGTVGGSCCEAHTGSLQYLGQGTRSGVDRIVSNTHCWRRQVSTALLVNNECCELFRKEENSGLIRWERWKPGSTAGAAVLMERGEGGSPPGSAFSFPEEYPHQELYSRPTCMAASKVAGNAFQANRGSSNSGSVCQESSPEAGL